MPENTSETDTTTSAGLIFYSTGEKWSYESRSSKGVLEGSLEPGKTYTTGWMDFSFKTEELLSHAIVKTKAVPSQGSQKGKLAVDISAQKNGRQIARQWLFPEKPLTIETENGPVIAAIGSLSSETPFSLTLKDFRKVDYPGTNKPSSFESDVILNDPKERLEIHKTISMNKPLDYKGYRIFQSSYTQDPVSGESSIFTVAKNPGIGLIYGGCIIMFAGVVMVFYINPLSSLHTRRPHDKKKN